ncbi:hypothetical protein AB434_2509 [Heyndrickxia coagulans]|uniref:Uncharacterized protein n=1 Tax=Heyndrickxia coagulans TaxID=1398 RepID=A0A0C5CA80_HEYCO|nr:hypothetical protein SB48_HM08orf04455 [Heyndrickxia coagulans]AKN54914.1 hypothetical protein AB434_2509 [Heyndrickxia coagulans]KWZ77240.1 hypothetical protein HMPREF3213_03429 [Heyndrickxia coagulans]KYC90483.1 hypothetical protein B4096_0147 [Heyndrickxia coagulans]
MANAAPASQQGMKIYFIFSITPIAHGMRYRRKNENQPAHISG